jgi:hypothetical protein
MAGTAPTNKELMAIIATLQAQVAPLTAMAPVVAAAQPTGAAPVVFADMPQMLGVNDLINYSTKQGLAIFEQGCKALDHKALTDGSAMTPNQTIIFIEAFHCCATQLMWLIGRLTLQVADVGGSNPAKH